jgi:hypothetical protein
VNRYNEIKLDASGEVYLGPGHRLVSELRAAETDAMALARAQDLTEALPSLHRRRILSTFSRVTFLLRGRR